MGLALEEPVLVSGRTAVAYSFDATFEQLVLAIAVNTGLVVYPVDADLVLDALDMIEKLAPRSSLGYSTASAFRMRNAGDLARAAVSSILSDYAHHDLYLTEAAPGAYVPSVVGMGAWVVDSSPIHIGRFLPQQVAELVKYPGLVRPSLEQEVLRECPSSAEDFPSSADDALPGLEYHPAFLSPFRPFEMMGATGRGALLEAPLVPYGTMRDEMPRFDYASALKTESEPTAAANKGVPANLPHLTFGLSRS